MRPLYAAGAAIGSAATASGTHNCASRGKLKLLGISSARGNTKPAGITPTTATINGQVLSNGGYVPTVTFFYGPVNGGANPANWSNSIVLGDQNGSFSQIVSGLTANTTYYFAVRAQNYAGTSWATPSRSFVTGTASLPQVNNAPATGIGATAASMASSEEWLRSLPAPGVSNRASGVAGFPVLSPAAVRGPPPMSDASTDSLPPYPPTRTDNVVRAIPKPHLTYVRSKAAKPAGQ